MLIGLTGSICAGKHTVAEYLVQHHGFLRLHLPVQPRINTASPDALQRLLPSVTDEKGTRGLTFPDVDALLDFVTKRWREHWVLTDIYDEETLDRLMVRPFFLLLSVDAAVSRRWSRFSARLVAVSHQGHERTNELNRCKKRSLTPWPLEAFVAVNDAHLYGTPIPSPINNEPPTRTQGPTPAITLTSRANTHLLNNHTTISTFYHTLDTLDLPSPTRLRPTWDVYFMTLASLAAQRSNCMKRRVGCVLTSPDNRITSTGYNGTPRNLTNCNAGGCARCNAATSASQSHAHSLATCLCLHAEENALLEAGRERIKPGSVLYCDTCPCLTCSVKITQVGIAEVVYSQGYNMDEATARVFAEAGVRLRQFSPPKSGLVSLGLGADGLGLEHEGGQAEGLGLGEAGRQVVLRNGSA